MLDIILYVTAGVMVMLVPMMGYFKDFYQRLICMGMFGNIGVVLIVVLGSYQDNQSFFDIAIIYLLLSYVVNMAVLRLLD